MYFGYLHQAGDNYKNVIKYIFLLLKPFIFTMKMLMLNEVRKL